ncbi:MAG: hypothetical protein ACLRWP_19670 [Bilophila wadsworthia]
MDFILLTHAHIDHSASYRIVHRFKGYHLLHATDSGPCRADA